MAIKDEIARITQAKQDFKTKLIEKGVAVSDDELISDYPPKLDLIKGGATITTPSGWVGTAVPNSGYVEKVYFNTNLSVEEVVGLLEGIEKQSIMGNTGCVVLTTNNHLLCALYNEGVWAIGDLSTGAFYFASADVGSGFTGWDSNFNGVIEINEEVGNIVGGEEVVFQNDKLSSLFSTTPFVQGGEQVLLEGEYDGSTLVLDELPKGGWNGSVVPNTGYVEKVYLNTNLSVEEVENLISGLTYIDYQYYVLFEASGEVGISIVYTPLEFGININGEILFDNIDGWHINTLETYGNPFMFNKEAISEGPGFTIGAENDKLSSLFSTTPFTQGQGVINIKSLIDQKKIPLEIKVNVEEGTNTTDATATANEIRKGFTAYVSSGKVEGAIEDYDGAFEGGVEILNFEFGSVENVVVNEYGVITWDALDVSKYANYNPTVSYIVDINGNENTVTTNTYNGISYMAEGQNTITVTGKIVFNFTKNGTDKVEVVQFTMPTEIIYVSYMGFELATAVNNAAGATYNNKLYYVNGSYYLRIVDFINKTNNSIKLFDIFLKGSNTFNAVVYKDKIYFIGVGRDGTSYIEYMYILDPSTLTVTTKDINTILGVTLRQGTRVTVVGDKFYIFDPTSSTKIICYDPNDDSFEFKNISSNYYGGLCPLGDKIYLFGGSSSSDQKAIKYYDTTTDTITYELRSNVYFSGNNIIVVVIDNNMYIVYGNKIYLYDMTSKTLTTIDATLPDSRGTSAYNNLYSFIDGKLYIPDSTLNYAKVQVVHNLK